MDTPTPAADRIRLLAWAAIAGQVLFTLAWLVSGAVQSGGYSPARHDISDRGALTADLPWLMLVGSGICGVATVAFAFGALGPELAVAGHRIPVSAWLVAGSAVGLDNLSDASLRLDCRAADPAARRRPQRRRGTGRST